MPQKAASGYADCQAVGNHSHMHGLFIDVAINGDEICVST